MLSLSLFYVSPLSSLIPLFLASFLPFPLSPSLSSSELSPYRKHRDTTFFSDTNDSVDSVDVGKQAQVVLQIRSRARGPFERGNSRLPPQNTSLADRASNLLLPSDFKVCVSRGCQRASERRARGPEGRLRPPGSRPPPPPSCARSNQHSAAASAARRPAAGRAVAAAAAARAVPVCSERGERAGGGNMLHRFFPKRWQSAREFLASARSLPNSPALSPFLRTAAPCAERLPRTCVARYSLRSWWIRKQSHFYKTTSPILLGGVG